LYVFERAGITSQEQVALCPQADRMYRLLVQSDNQLKEIGYEDMPEGFYEDFLERVKQEKMKPENQQFQRLHQIVR
jgi:hypothetical protein